MRVVWTEEALDDLEEILVHYHQEASPRTAAAVERRIIEAVESLEPFPERIRESERVPGARELVVGKVPYIVFLRLMPEAMVVLNVVHTAKQFPP
jgi:toxin ParE1/3/4